MGADFLFIAVTPPEPLPGEGRLIAERLTRSGYDRVHLRHPGAGKEVIAAILRDVPRELRGRVMLHDHPQIAVREGAGVSINGRNRAELAALPRVPHQSIAAHSLEELSEPGVSAGQYDYVLLSPIFDSVSKAGYKGRFNPRELQVRTSVARSGTLVVALGGVTDDNIGDLREAGFAGAALLGDARWQRCAPLQFITDGATPQEIIAQSHAALRGGVRWVQLRMKGCPIAEVLPVARELAELCRSYGATFIVNDHPSVALAAGADGVHLGRSDMSPEEARRLLGPTRIIGATINNLADGRRLLHAPIDYYGIGPYRGTATKKNLAPLLGADGIRALAAQLAREGLTLPHVAIGGVRADDIPLLADGAMRRGVAVSGAIAHAPDVYAAAAHFTAITGQTFT